MADKRHASVELKDWFHHCDGMSLFASATVAGDEAHLIRLFHNLLERAPSPAQINGLVLPETLNIESYLSVGAHDHAALAFLGAGTSFCLSHGGDGYMASILLPHQGDERTASGATMAAACIAAMALALADGTACARGKASPKLMGSALLH
jgi:hypothetical protein